MEAYKLGFLLGHAMDSKKWWVFGIACLSIIAAYQVGKFAGENTAEVRLSEKQLAFQKEREATHKAEFAKLLRIYKEEKRAEEKHRREEKSEEREKEVVRMLMESRDRLMKDLETLMQSTPYPSEDKQTALYRMLLESLTQTTEHQATVPDYLFNDYPAATSTKDSPVSPSTTKAQGGKTYINAGGGHWVSKNIDHGKYIKLEDGSLWEVSPIDKIEGFLWLPTSGITVVESQNPLYPYFLINTDDDEKVEAKLISD